MNTKHQIDQLQRRAGSIQTPTTAPDIDAIRASITAKLEAAARGEFTITARPDDGADDARAAILAQIARIAES